MKTVPSLCPLSAVRALLLAAVLAPLPAAAGLVEETLVLSPGWNAVYLESTPDDSDAESFFGALPVLKATCLVPGAGDATAQLASDGREIVQKPVAHLLWDSAAPEDSTLGQVLGGRCYFIYATAAASNTFLGTPQLPRVSWQVSDDGFATYAPVSIPAGRTVLSSAYFADAPCGAANAARPYAVMGTNAAAPSFGQLNAFSGKPTLQAGRVYAFASDAAGDWPGVLDVSVGLTGALDFPDGVSKASLSVRNASSADREIRLALAPSAREGDTAPDLLLFEPPAAAASSGWVPFSATNVLLAAGEKRDFFFQCDKAAFGTNAACAAVLSVSDLGGSKMRVRVPVTAAADTYPEGTAAYPAGLWIGQAALSQVSAPDGSLADAGGVLKGTVILHVAADGAMTLLQRVAAGKVRDDDGTWRPALWRDLPDVPTNATARRVSCVFIDTANRAVPATANTDTSAPKFGREATFRFAVGERSAENPFRHAWHPDHDGLQADYSGPAPSGDDPNNFIGEIKPESFTVSNRIAFVWADDNGLPTYSRTPEESTFGRLDWTLEGLRRAPIQMRGLFVLKRVSDASTIQGE